MARKKKGGGGGGGGSWLDTYADMVTLLLTFFVMLYSMSSVTEDKWEVLIKAFANPGDQTTQIVLAPDEGKGDEVGGNTDDGSMSGETEDENPPEAISLEELTFDSLYEYLKQYVEEKGAEGTVEVNKGEDSVFIRFNDAIFFNPDSYELRADSYEILSFLGDAIVHVETEIEIVMVAGHTAMVQGYYPVSDWRLSGNRASSVIIYFEEEKEFPKMKLSAIGHGAKYPVDTNDTAEGRRNNRRVEIMILGNQTDQKSQEVFDYFLNGTYDESKYPADGSISDIMNNNVDPETGEPIVSEPTSSEVSSEPTSSEVSSESISSEVSSEPTSSEVSSEPTSSVVVPPVSSSPTSSGSDDLLAPPL